MDAVAEKAIVEELKGQWKMLWLERFDDKVRAEGIAEKDYSALFVEKGTVIFATRDFKPLNFREILEHHKLQDAVRVQPSPSEGGWGKFVRTAITGGKRNWRARRLRPDADRGKEKQQLRKGGRGWLHV